jgi:hypothetical protein
MCQPVVELYASAKYATFSHNEKLRTPLSRATFLTINPAFLPTRLGEDPNFFAQFGRVFRRFDRSARRYLGWLELAACIILLRSGFVS